MIKEFKKEAGAGCMTSARPDVFDELSAEEGGCHPQIYAIECLECLIYLDFQV